MNIYCVLFFSFITTIGSASELEELVKALGDEDYATRTSAHETLRKWAFKKKFDGLKALVEQQDKSKSPEVKARLAFTIAELGTEFSQLGAMGAEFEEAPNGVKIKQTFFGMAAHVAGMKSGDIIEQMGHTNLSKLSKNPANILQEFNSIMLDMNMGERLNLKVRRGKQLLDIKITLTARAEQTKQLFKDQQKAKPMQFHQWIEPEMRDFNLGK